MEISINNNTPQPGEKDWTIEIDGTGDNYTVGEAIAKLEEVKAMMLAATPSGPNEESSNP